MKHKCAYCGKPSGRSPGEINRAQKQGLKLYCNRKCAGLGRRVNKTTDEKKEEKQWYDLFYRQMMADELKQKKAAWHKKHYSANPDHYRQKRMSKRAYHKQYVSTATYRAYKQRYDERHRAEKIYGEYAESAILIKQITSLIDKQQSRQDRDCHNKNQKRKKQWKNLQP